MRDFWGRGKWVSSSTSTLFEVSLLFFYFPFSVNSHEFLLLSSGTDRGETVFVPGWVESLSSEGSLKGIGLNFLESVSGIESFAFFSLTLVWTISVISEDVGTILVIFIQHFDLQAIQKSPFLQQEHFLVKHIYFGPLMQQPTVCSPLLDFLVWGGLLGDCAVLFSSTNVLFWEGKRRGECVKSNLFVAFLFLYLVSDEWARSFFLSMLQSLFWLSSTVWDWTAILTWQ